jgi:L-alanine-DL-glutamate epimerase-like enolase superfamily enzyme
MSALSIERADVIVASPGRNFVTLKITTSDGIIGWGDATLNGRELAVASHLSDHVAPLLSGRDAQAIENTWQPMAMVLVKELEPYRLMFIEEPVQSEHLDFSSGP